MEDEIVKEKPDFIIVVNKGQVTSVQTTKIPYLKYAVINIDDKEETITKREKIYKTDDSFVDFEKFLNILSKKK